MRIDKFLCDCGLGSRSQVKKLIKQGQIKVNEIPAKDPSQIIDENNDIIFFKGSKLAYEKELYYLFHKPAGCVTANTDKTHKTVFDYFPDELRGRLNAVGRLDLDTEGLLLLTSDGSLLHHLISPKHKIPKKYYAILDQPVPKDAIETFAKGIDIGDSDPTLPAELEILEPTVDTKYHANLTIYEGRFHQVKRMFETLGCKVIYLKRISEGGLSLADLPKREYRKLTEEEINSLR